MFWQRPKEREETLPSIAKLVLKKSRAWYVCTYTMLFSEQKAVMSIICVFLLSQLQSLNCFYCHYSLLFKVCPKLGYKNISAMHGIVKRYNYEAGKKVENSQVEIVFMFIIFVKNSRYICNKNSISILWDNFYLN